MYALYAPQPENCLDPLALFVLCWAAPCREHVMSSASSTYPPAPQRRPSPPLSPSSSRSGSPPGATLYGRSPHRHRDTLFRRRRERFNCGLDPLHVVALIVLAGILLASRPELLSPDTYLRPFSTRPSPTLRPCDLPSQRNGKRAKCDCSHCSQDTIMVWQKTFTLPSASKGCHLVTPAVEREISDGVKGVKAGLITLFIQHTSAALSVNENYDSTGEPWRSSGIGSVSR